MPDQKLIEIFIHGNYTSFFNSRETRVQPPTVTLIVQNKQKQKKNVFYNWLTFFQCANHLIFSVTLYQFVLSIFYLFSTYCAAI
jgi:hypothetical protein